jgi:hypothetical protein
MPNVLLVTYPFPPSGTVGVPRALAYIRHLRSHGCHMSVLTATKPQTPGSDQSLTDSIQKDVAVHRAWNPELPFTVRDRVWKKLMSLVRNNSKTPQSVSGSVPSHSRSWSDQKMRFVAQYLFFPDPQRTWVPFAVRKACRVIRIEVYVKSVRLPNLLLNHDTPPGHYSINLQVAFILESRYMVLTLGVRQSLSEVYIYVRPCASDDLLVCKNYLFFFSGAQL